MPEIEARITISRPREEVYDYLARPENQTVWQSNLVEFAADWKDQPDVGERSKGAVRVAGKRVSWTTEITEAQRPERLAFRSVEAPFPFAFAYDLSGDSGTTEVTYRGSTESMGGFFGRIADPIVARMYERDMRANLENLKALLEEQH